MANEKNFVTQSQVYMLFTLYLFTTMLGFRLGTLVKQAQFTTWISLIIGSFLGFLITYLSFRLAVKRPDQFFGFYGKEIVGKWLHYPFVLLMIFSFLFSSSFLLREMQDFIIEVYLPDTPDWAVTVLFSVCIAYAVRSGVGTIFRCAQGVFFMSVIGMLLVPPFVASEMNPQMSIALINHFEASGIWHATYLTAALYGEMAFILFLFPYFSNYQRTMKSLGWAIITSLLIILSNLIPILLIFGPQLTGNMNYPELELIRYIRAGAFLENLDPVLMVVWLTSLFIKISLFLYVAVIVLTHTLGLRDHKPLTFSMTALMVGLCLFMVKTKTELAHLLLHGEIVFLLITEFIPAIYLLVDWVRTKKAPGQTSTETDNVQH